MDNNLNNHPYYPLELDEFKDYLLKSGLTIEDDTGLVVSHNQAQGGGGWPTLNDLKKVLEATPHYDKKFDLPLFLVKEGSHSIDENNFIITNLDIKETGGWPHWVDFAVIQRKIGEHYHPELKEAPLIQAEDLPEGVLELLLDSFAQESEKKRANPMAANDVLKRIQNIRDNGLDNNLGNKPKN